MFETLVVPSYIIAGSAFGFGIIVGSFLNVVIYRLHTNRSLTGRSHCLSCGVELQWYDLFPLVSYIVLQARCRNCTAYITPRYFVVELLTGLLFFGIVATVSGIIPVLLFLAVTAVLVVILVYDYYHFIIPDSMVMLLTFLAGAWVLYQYLQGVLTLEGVWLSFLSAVLAAGFFFLLWAVSKGRALGFGDVKLIFPLALLIPMQLVFSFVVLAFWIGAIVSLLLLLLQYLYYRGKPHLRFLKKPLTMKSAVPFAPFIIISFFCIVFFEINVLQLVDNMVW